MPAIHQDFRKILLKEKNSALEGLDELHALLFDQLAEEATVLPFFEINSAYQGQEALTFIKEACAVNKPYAVAFVDVIMPPGEDGIETIRHIWQEDPEIQTIICTAYTIYSWEDIVKRLGGGSDRLFILKKPFETTEIIELASLLTKKWNLNRQLQEAYSQNSIIEVEEVQSELHAISEKLKKSGHSKS